MMGIGNYAMHEHTFSKPEGESTLLTYATSTLSNSDEIPHSVEHGSEFGSIAVLGVEIETLVVKVEQRVCELNAVV